MVGVLVRIGERVTAHRIIRNDVLQCLYGKAAEGAMNLISFSLEDLRLVAQNAGISAASNITSGGLTTGDFHATGQESVGDALRTAALMYSSMSAIDKFDEQDAEDAPQPEEVNRRFATEVREHVVAMRPDLERHFGRKAEILESGKPVAFGFCSPSLAAHFSTLHPVRQSASVRDARAKLWELYRLREYAQIRAVCLIVGRPLSDDPTLSQRQRASLEENIREIELEADSYEMRLFPVFSAEQGARKILEYHMH